MVDQKDIFRSAHILIKQYGDVAERFALDKMQKHMNDEDVVAASAWLMIAQAIEELNKNKPSGTVH